MDYGIVNKIMCSLEGGLTGVLTCRLRNSRQGLLKAKIGLLLKQLFAWGVTTHQDLPN